MQENAPRHRNDVEMINCYGLVLLKKRQCAGCTEGGGQVHDPEVE